MERDQDGSCDFVVIEDKPIPLYNIDHSLIDQDAERITTFIRTLIEYSGLRFYSEENFLLEALTFILLTCNIDIQDKFNLFYYQLQNDYVPWDFSAPIDDDVNDLNFLDLFKSLVNVFLRLDVNRKVMQCYHCRSKCSCDVVATFLLEELNIFTMQDPIKQEANQNAENENTPVRKFENQINMLSSSFIVDIPEFYQHISSQNFDATLRDNGNSCSDKHDSRDATPLCNHTPDVENPHIWKGHSDEGIPFINFDAMYGHTENDLDLQLDCKV